MKELIDNILKFDADEYLRQSEAFVSKNGIINDGNSTERLVDFIVNL